MTNLNFKNRQKQVRTLKTRVQFCYMYLILILSNGNYFHLGFGRSHLSAFILATLLLCDVFNNRQTDKAKV